MVDHDQGGTLLLFAKLRGTDGINPGVELRSSVPVCVVLKTAEEGRPQPTVVVDANPGWRHGQSAERVHYSTT